MKKSLLNKTTIKRLLKEASRQSENIIVDLRRAKIDDRTSIKILKNEYSLRRVIKKVKIITKQGDELNCERDRIEQEGDPKWMAGQAFFFFLIFWQ